MNEKYRFFFYVMTSIHLQRWEAVLPTPKIGEGLYAPIKINKESVHIEIQVHFIWDEVYIYFCVLEEFW